MHTKSSYEVCRETSISQSLVTLYSVSKSTHEKSLTTFFTEPLCIPHTNQSVAVECCSRETELYKIMYIGLCDINACELTFVQFFCLFSFVIFQRISLVDSQLKFSHDDLNEVIV